MDKMMASGVYTSTTLSLHLMSNCCWKVSTYQRQAIVIS